MTDPSPTDLPRGHQAPNTTGSDPTPLTAALIDKAVAQVREIYDGRLQEKAEAVRLLHEDMVRVPTLLDRRATEIETLSNVKLAAQQDLRDEKFASVDIRFSERDKREDKLAEANKEAISAALLAAKELVAVHNANFAAQVSDLKSSFTTQLLSLESKFTDLKDRFNQRDGALSGEQQSRSNRRADIGPMAGIVTAGVTVLMLMGTIATVVLARPQPAAPAPPPQVIYAPPVSATAPPK